MYGQHKIRGKWRMYVGTVDEVIVQKGCAGREKRAAILQWEDHDEGDNERLRYPEARSRSCPQGREIEIQEQLVPEQEVQELEGEEVSASTKSKKIK